MPGGRRSVALQGHSEGLTPAHDQTLPVDLPGAVSRVVLATSQVDAKADDWGGRRSVCCRVPAVGGQDLPAQASILDLSSRPPPSQPTSRACLYSWPLAPPSFTHTHQAACSVMKGFAGASPRAGPGTRNLFV